MTQAYEDRHFRFLFMIYYRKTIKQLENFEPIVRKLLAGQRRIHPIELHIWLGGQPGHFHSELEQEIRSVLTHHGYSEEFDFDDPLLGTIWVRNEEWVEDNYWRDLIYYGREAMIARLMTDNPK